jgi:hypothetical protein
LCILRPTWGQAPRSPSVAGCLPQHGCPPRARKSPHGRLSARASQRAQLFSSTPTGVPLAVAMVSLIASGGLGHCFPQRRNQQHRPAGLHVLHAVRLRASFSSLVLIELSPLDTTFVHTGALGPTATTPDRGGKSPGTANLTTEHVAGVEPVALLVGRACPPVGPGRKPAAASCLRSR